MALSEGMPMFLANASELSLNTRPHWASASQSYTPVTVLMQYLAEGWELGPVVGSEKYCWGGGRHITIYHFELVWEQRVLMMRVKGNPVVRRLLHQYPCQLVPLRD